MKTQLYPIIIICIIILVCSSCSITRQTTCPTFANKTEKVQKPLFSKKKSAKKKKQQLPKIVDQTKKARTKKNSLVQIENLLSKIEMSDIIASSENDITLNSMDIAPTFVESKLQKFIYKKIEKKSKKILKNLEKHNQEKDVEENCEQVISKKKHKKKHKKTFSNKDDDPTDEREVHDLAILSLMASIIVYLTPFLFPLIGFWFLIALLLSLIFATIWGFLALKKIKQNPSKYKGKKVAIAGLIVCAITLSIITALSVV